MDRHAILRNVAHKKSGPSTITMPSMARRGRTVLSRRCSVVYPIEHAAVYSLDTMGAVVGRQPQGDTTITLEDGQVSGSHAALEFVEASNTFRLHDLGSKNRTYLNGRHLKAPEHLQSGAVIRVGGTMLVFSEIAPKCAFEMPSGTSLALAHAQALADLTAPSSLPVLVTGPTGAGKEVLARRIHDASGRSGRFVAINCATFSRELIGSELFGHTKGAYSGAAQSRPGLFAAAHGGTLFLDEIAELPLDQQSMLLRALQEKQIRPIGSDHDVAVDVRVLAATHKDLEQLEAAGQFRADLSARLAGVTIVLPGLSQRREEILSLFAQFLGQGAAPLSLEAAEALLIYSWPKNIRELMHAASGAKLFAQNANQTDLQYLPTAVQRHWRVLEGPTDEKAQPSKEELEVLLVEHKGNVTKIAQGLGKHRAQINRWLKAYHLTAEDYREKKR